MPFESRFVERRPMPELLLSPTRCPIPGCSDLKMRRNLLCLKHSVEVWGNVQSSNGEPLIQDAIVESVAEREQRAAAEEARRAEVRKANGSIYYIRVDDKVKIGWTSNLPQRMKSYPPHMVLLTDHPGTRADERDLHRTFKPSRASGREWYHPTQELLAHIGRAHDAEQKRRDEEHLARLTASAEESDAVFAASNAEATLLFK